MVVMMISVLLVDDHATLRQGLRMCFALEPDLMVVGEAADGAEAIQLAVQERPDVVVLDIEMPGMSGFEVAPELARKLPDVSIVFLSFRDDPATREQALAAGGKDLVSKQVPPDMLIAAIRRAAAGKA